VEFAIGRPEVNEDDAGYTIEAELHHDEVRPSLWFRLPPAYRPDETTVGDPFLASMLPVAMARGENISIDAPVSAKLIESLDEIQGIYAGWYPDVLARVEVHAAEVVSPKTTGTGTMSTFTGGVDSFYTLVKHKEELDAVLYVEGFDVPLSNMVLARTVRNTIRSVAESYGKEAVFLASNLKTFTDKELNWGLIAHGPALASVGLLLQGHIDKMYIPSTHSLKQMFPWGSHVLVDHLWSTDRMAFVHDGADASRVTKTLAISGESAPQQYLRVCWQNRGPYNCGRCEKCLRTMTALELMGALDKFTVFPEIDLPAAVGALRIANQNGLEFQLENLEYAHEIGSTSPVVPALTRSIESFRARKGESATTKPPFAGSRFAKVPMLRKEVVALRKEVVALRKENSRLKTRLDAVERTLPRRVRRRLARAYRRVVPKH